MIKQRILVTGASGMLGASLVAFFSKEHMVFATGNSQFKDQPKNYKVFDLSSPSYKKLIDWAQPTVIIHSGALTNGNYCDEHPEKAFALNGVAVKKLMDATTDEVKIIYISTDAVFPSSIHLAKENDCTIPESIYGKSKELGEFFLLNSYRQYSIIRTTIVGLNLNKNKQGFVEWIINSSKNDTDINLFDDVVFTPISIWELAVELKFLIENDSINSEILHITGSEIVSKYEFGIQLLQALSLKTTMIYKGSILNFKNRAKRSTDQSLDVNLYCKKYQRSLPKVLQTINTIKRYYEK